MKPPEIKIIKTGEGGIDAESDHDGWKKTLTSGPNAFSPEEADKILKTAVEIQSKKKFAELLGYEIYNLFMSRLLERKESGELITEKVMLEVHDKLIQELREVLATVQAGKHPDVSDEEEEDTDDKDKPE